MSPIVECVFPVPALLIVYGRKTTRVTFVVMFFLCVIFQVFFVLLYVVTLVTFVLFLSMLCSIMFSHMSVGTRAGIDREISARVPKYKSVCTFFQKFCTFFQNDAHFFTKNPFFSRFCLFSLIFFLISI